jgi:hypothetical protein
MSISWEIPRLRFFIHPVYLLFNEAFASQARGLYSLI